MKWSYRIFAKLLALVSCLVLSSAPARAQDVDWTGVRQEAADFLGEYIRINTTNPPGNERPAADFLAARLGREGLETKVFDPGDGRASVMARLRGRGDGRPVVLLNHLDVVPASGEGWDQPPFAGKIANGYVYGRGALDCKGLGVVEAMALVVMKRAGIVPARDVIFLATADEEAGGALGAGRFVREHFDELGRPEFVLNEGGGIRKREDGRRVYVVAVAEKTPLWLRLTATGTPGHGSVPRPDSAVLRLLAALDKIRDFRPAVRVVAQVQEYYRASAGLYDEPERSFYRDLRAGLKDSGFRDAFLARPADAALVRNTISITVLSGSDKTNVIPRQAIAELDCRLLPGEDPAAFVSRLKAAVGDDGIEFTELLRLPPSSSSSDSALYRAIAAVATRENTLVVPGILRGFTDSHFFRERGVVSYGFLPVEVTEEEERTMHGLNERMSLTNLGEAPRRLVAILQALDGDS